jgi:hypothetical protein
MEVERVALGRRVLRHGEQLAAVSHRRGVDHRSAGLVAERRGEQPGTGGGGRAARGEGVQPLLQSPEILRARDDLLSRIAALLEADATERVQVERLRHELVGRGGRHERNTRAHLREPPCVLVARRGGARERTVQRRHALRRPSTRDAAVGQPEQHDVVLLDRSARARRATQDPAQRVRRERARRGPCARVPNPGRRP